MAKSRVKFVVSDKDLGWDKLGREIQKSSQIHVTAGVHGSDRGRTVGAIDNVQLATVHEFGAPQVGIPERSWLRSTVDARLRDGRWPRLLAKVSGDVYATTMSTRQALNIMGLAMASSLRRTIDTSGASAGAHWPNLKPATVARKGSAKALIDTRELIRSIRHRVVA